MTFWWIQFWRVAICNEMIYYSLFFQFYKIVASILIGNVKLNTSPMCQAPSTARYIILLVVSTTSQPTRRMHVAVLISHLRHRANTHTLRTCRPFLYAPQRFSCKITREKVLSEMIMHWLRGHLSPKEKLQFWKCLTVLMTKVSKDWPFVTTKCGMAVTIHPKSC